MLRSDHYQQSVGRNQQRFELVKRVQPLNKADVSTSFSNRRDRQRRVDDLQLRTDLRVLRA